MPLRETGQHVLRRGNPLLGHPRDVREHARPLEDGAGLGVDPKRGELVLDRTDGGQCRRHDLPSRWMSSSAEGGPHEPAA